MVLPPVYRPLASLMLMTLTSHCGSDPADCPAMDSPDAGELPATSDDNTEDATCLPERGLVISPVDAVVVASETRDAPLYGGPLAPLSCATPNARSVPAGTRVTVHAVTGHYAQIAPPYGLWILRTSLEGVALPQVSSTTRRPEATCP